MRDYIELVKALMCCVDGSCEGCPRLQTPEGEFDCKNKLKTDAADAIEELVAAVPPLLWTDEQIKGSEFMTHVQGGRGFEIHFRTDNAEKYKAVQEECRRQIDHAKPDPPKEDAECKN